MGPKRSTERIEFVRGVMRVGNIVESSLIFESIWLYFSRIESDTSASAPGTVLRLHIKVYIFKKY